MGGTGRWDDAGGLRIQCDVQTPKARRRVIIIQWYVMHWYPRLLASGLLGVSCLTVSPPAVGAEPLADGLYAVWETPRGSFTAELDYELAPLAVANFVGLAEGTIPFTGRPPGHPFFDGLRFHRVVAGFVVQGGDPLGTGKGDPGYTFADEFTPLLKHDAAGTLSMANAGPNTNGCQFFLTLAPVNRLNYKHSVFGRVVQGLDVLPHITVGDVMTHVRIVRVGARARSFRADAASFAALRDNTPVIPPRDPALPPLFANTAGVELRNGYDAWLNEKLHNYEVVTGITIWVRMLPRFVPPPIDAVNAPFNPLRTLHQELAGENPHAATIVFTADDQRWRLWLGDDLLDRLGLSPAAAGTAAGARRLHAHKQAILAKAKSLWSSADEPRYRAIDAAATQLIEALDRPKGNPGRNDSI